MIQTNWLQSNSIIGLLLICGTALAQNTLQDYKQAYPDYNEIILNDVQTYDFSIVDKKLKIIQDNRFESMILSEHGIQNNEESFTYSELVRLISYDAFSVLNNNGREKKLKVTQSNEKQSRHSTVFYDDVKERQLIFPGLEAGAKKVYSYQMEFVDPFLLHKFIFGSMFPIKNSTFELTVGKDINIGYKVFNDPTNSIVFTKSEKKGKTVYRWTLSDVKPVKFESNAPGYLHIVPHVDVYVKDYVVDNKSIRVLDDTSHLFDYYKGFVKELNKTDDPNLKAKALQLTESESTDEEKLKKIFYWVKDNIKYIAFENGYEGFIPREAKLVYERKFGDCKDMASIITAMAGYAGIPNVTLSWIGTREIPYTYEQLSTPAVDNHMIAVFRDGNRHVFLDATDKETRYGLPTAFIQGKEALISENDTYKIVTVPVVPANENRVTEEIQLSIDGARLTGKGKIAFTGYSRSHILAQIGDATEKQRFEMIKSLVLKGNNKFHLKEYAETNLKSRDLPYTIDYSFDLDNYMVALDKERYINMYMEKPFEKHTIEADRVSDYEFEYLPAMQTRYELEIPDGHQVTHIPQNSSIDNDVMKAEFKYSQSDKKLFLTAEIQLKKLVLKQPDFALWNQTVKTLRNTYTETITLTQK